MVGIQGLGGVPEPKPDRPSGVRDSKQGASADETSSSSDGVVISSEAQAAAVVASSIHAAQDQPEIRADRVEAAKASIERGDFKDPEVVQIVADRISKLL